MGKTRINKLDRVRLVVRKMNTGKAPTRKHRRKHHVGYSHHRRLKVI